MPAEKLQQEGAAVQGRQLDIVAVFVGRAEIDNLPSHRHSRGIPGLGALGAQYEPQAADDNSQGGRRIAQPMCVTRPGVCAGYDGKAHQAVEKEAVRGNVDLPDFSKPGHHGGNNHNQCNNAGECGSHGPYVYTFDWQRPLPEGLSFYCI